MLTYALKVKMTIKYINKIKLLKNKNFIMINNLFSSYITALHYIYLIYTNKAIYSKIGFINHIFLIFINKIKKNDKVFY